MILTPVSSARRAQGAPLAQSTGGIQTARKYAGEPGIAVGATRPGAAILAVLRQVAVPLARMRDGVTPALRSTS